MKDRKSICRYQLWMKRPRGYLLNLWKEEGWTDKCNCCLVIIIAVNSESWLLCNLVKHYKWIKKVTNLKQMCNQQLTTQDIVVFIILWRLVSCDISPVQPFEILTLTFRHHLIAQQNIVELVTRITPWHNAKSEIMAQDSWLTGYHGHIHCVLLHIKKMSTGHK